jgi:thioredoxin-dependent peroxiredoxin
MPVEALMEGKPAPNFSVIADDGSTVSLADFRGRHLILYFYPKANTSGCTHEAVGFRDRMMDFQALKTSIVGVSGDTVEEQLKFKERYSLNFPLLADTEFSAIEAYEARRMKSFFGKSFLGIVRMTFWIGPEGTIRRIWPRVAVNGHADEALAAIRESETKAATA